MPVYRTKGELRSSLLIKLGYGGLGAAASGFVPMVDELLSEAQEQLFLFLPDDKKIKEWEWNTGIGQRFYDFPPGADPDRICEIAAFFEQTWLPLNRGINSYHDSIFSYVNYYPQRYDIRARDIAGELQTNNDFSVSDTTLTGGFAGWTWDSGGAEISGGKLRQISILAAKSLQTCIVGNLYDITYQISGRGASLVRFGGSSVDINGSALNLTIGTHTHRVQAATADGLAINTNGASPPVELDDVSVKDVSGITTKEQLELWPVSNDTSYKIKLEGFIKLAPFVKDGDRATIDDTLILLYAEAYGKAHLNKPDANLKMNALSTRLNKLRGQQHEGKRYIRKDKTPPPLPRPIVIP